MREKLEKVFLKVLRFLNKTYPAAMISIVIDNNPNIHPKFQLWQYSIPNIHPRKQSSVSSDSGDSTWPDPSISFSQKITGDIKIKIENLFRSI